jgi:hypothetical protein
MIIKIGDFSGTSVSNFDLDNIFTSTYDVYDIKINSIDMVNTSNTSINFQYLDSSGNPISSSTYKRTGTIYNTTNDTWNYSDNYSTTFGSATFIGGAADDTEGMLDLRIFDPNNSSTYTTAYVEGNGWHTSGFVYITRRAIVEQTAQAVRGIRLFADMNFNSVSATVWGYSKS